MTFDEINQAGALIRDLLSERERRQAFDEFMAKEFTPKVDAFDQLRVTLFSVSEWYFERDSVVGKDITALIKNEIDGSILKIEKQLESLGVGPLGEPLKASTNG